MLTKLANVTVLPGSPGQTARAASHSCVVLDTQVPAPPGPPPPTPTPPSGDVVVPADGTPIVLETPNGAGGYDVTASVAPAPAGYVCRLEPVLVIEPGSLNPATQYHVVCTGG